MMLVGNKVDLEESNEREVSTETGETFAKVKREKEREREREREDSLVWNPYC